MGLGVLEFRYCLRKRVPEIYLYTIETTFGLPVHLWDGE